MNSAGKNPAYAVDGMLVALADGADLERILEEKKLSALEVMNMMKSRRGQALIKARRRLAKIHREILASRFSAFAVQRICGVLQQEEKPELWLKAAAEVLAVAKGERRSARKGGGEKEGGMILYEPEERKRLMEAICMVLEAEEKRRKGAAGG